jgi:hypothetical protein
VHTEQLHVAFLAIDPERLGEELSDGMLTDLGDDILHYKKGTPAALLYNDQINWGGLKRQDIIHPNLRTFLQGN